MHNDIIVLHTDRVAIHDSLTFAIEHGRTFGARPRHIAIVIRHMIVQLRLRTHPRRAQRTRKVADVVVPHHVYLVRVLHIEALLADVALERILVDVHVRLHVLHQVRARLERFAARLADALHALLDAQMDAIGVLVDRSPVLVRFAAVRVVADEALGFVGWFRFRRAVAAAALLPVAMPAQTVELVEQPVADQAHKRL